MLACSPARPDGPLVRPGWLLLVPLAGAAALPAGWFAYLVALPAAAAGAVLAGYLRSGRSGLRAGPPADAWDRLAAGLLAAAVGAAVAVLPLSTVVGPLPASRAAVRLAAVLLVLTAFRPPRPGRVRRGWRPAAALLAACLAGAGLLAAPAAARSADPAGSARACTAATAARVYDVAAVNVAIPFNRWGQQVADGRIYVLQQDKAAVLNWSRPLTRDASGRLDPARDPAANRRLRPRPLILRANEGECVRVNFSNELRAAPSHGDGLPAGARASMHIAGAAYDVQTSDGSSVGFNDDSTVGVGDARTYLWSAPEQEGLYLFKDQGVPAGGEHDGGQTGFGLFGGLAVEPAGSTWTDPRSGAALSGTGDPASTYTAVAQQSGELYIEADIHPSTGPSFRESVQLGWDEIPGIGMGFNYGSDSLSAREGKRCPDCLGEETWLSSWPYGDPALVKLASGPGPWPPKPGRDDQAEDCGLPESCYVSNVFHTYQGDPTKIRYGMAGVKETHVFHLHAHQWLADARDTAATGKGPGWRPQSQTIDAQSFGPGEAFNADLLFGAGSRNGTIGDSIFHCHLYPHFADGFWALLRVHDVTLDGATRTPDGLNVRPLRRLPDRAALPAPSADNPGYPGMIPGSFGWRAPQPPGSVTEGLTGRPAPRLVGGQPIDPARLALEAAVSRRAYQGRTPKPGAPFRDPCPVGAREVNYAVTVLQRDLVYNEAGQHDPQGRLLVLTKDVPAILAGTKKAEPLFVRVNAGDCVNFALTNMLPNFVGGDVFSQLAQTNMAGQHIHLVKFDVTASDGASNGWNYQQAAYTREQAQFERDLQSGKRVCRAPPQFYGDRSDSCRIPMPTSWDPTTRTTPDQMGQTLVERWYADYELRTVFTHDHHFAAIDQNRGLFGGLIVEPAGFDSRDPASGSYLQPVNDARHGRVCGGSCTGTAVGATMDLVGPGVNDDFREFGLALTDFVPLIKAGGDPRNRADAIGPPGAPEAFPQADPGTMAVNYRNAPLALRQSVRGRPVDPAYQFSSTVFGDPATPLLQAYSGDAVRIRVIQGSQEEQHQFMVNGLRWRKEPDDPESPLVNNQTVGISEAFNTEVPGIDCADVDRECRGDYLYSSASTDDTWNGMWGILRVHGKGVPTLRPLPDNLPRAPGAAALPRPTGQPPAPAVRPGNPCPPGAPTRRYDVVAMARDIVYNSAGDHDPNGLMYVLAADEAAVRAGTKRPEPLTIRAGEGDCIDVSLTNKLPPSWATHRSGTAGDPTLVMEPPTGTASGLRVSLHPQLLRYDVRFSDGATVGYNPDQTAGPGQTVRYRWYADDVPYGELGATNLLDFGDLRGHRHHGLFAGLNVEPAGSTWHDPVTGRETQSGAAADIRVPGRRDFREFTTFLQDGLNLVDRTGTAIPDAPAHPPVAGEPPAGPGDAEDQGKRGMNYASESFSRRLGYPPGQADPAVSADGWAGVFSSRAHGDPATPIWRAYSGDDLRMRVLQGADKSRGHSFTVSGALWKAEPNDPQSEMVSAVAGFSVGRAANVHLRAGVAGDYRYGCQAANQHLSGGMWGILRVYDPPAANAPLRPSPLAARDDPRSPGYAPIQPLERSQITATVYADTDADGRRDPGEPTLSGRTVRLVSRAGEPLAAEVADAAGGVHFSVPGGSYDARLDVGPGRLATPATAQRVDATADNSRTHLVLGMQPVSALPAGAAVPPGRGTSSVVVQGFDDINRNGRPDPGEQQITGWQVGLFDGTGRTLLASTTFDREGWAVFCWLEPGRYVVRIAMPRLAADTPPWTATTSAATVVQLSIGDKRTLRFGAAQPGAITTTVFNDNDRNGRWDGVDAPLADRTVLLRTADGRTVLAAAVTDATGRTAFPAIPGRRYLVELLTPTGWLVTTPAALRPAGSTRLAVSGPPAGGTTALLVGQYNGVDRTPPPPPVATPAPGAYPTAIPVSLTAEAGAAIRYTLDGSVPTATTGMAYTGPFLVARSRVVRAVAVDRAGNVGPVAALAYTINRPGPSGEQPAPYGWTQQQGWTRGTAADLDATDAVVFFLAAERTAGGYAADGYGQFRLPGAARRPAALTLTYAGGATDRHTTRTVAVYDWRAGRWTALQSIAQPLDTTTAVVDLPGDPSRFVSTAGELRVRVVATGPRPFELRVDQLSVSWQE